MSMTDVAAGTRSGGVPVGKLVLCVAVAALAWSLATTVPVWLAVQKVERALGKIELDPLLLRAIAAQNAALANAAQSDIDTLDAAWIAEQKSADGPLVKSMLASLVSTRLRTIIDATGSVVRHAILMDDRGRNVAIAAPTTDYWQGDEAKWTGTFAKGPSARHFGATELAHDGGRAVCWASMTISDPSSGRPIGAISIEVDANMVRHRYCNLAR